MPKINLLIFLPFLDRLKLNKKKQNAITIHKVVAGLPINPVRATVAAVKNSDRGIIFLSRQSFLLDRVIFAHSFIATLAQAAIIKTKEAPPIYIINKTTGPNINETFALSIKLLSNTLFFQNFLCIFLL